MNVQELETAHRLGLDMVVLVFNDERFALIEWKQIKDNWGDIFPTVDYQISCEVEILKAGMIGKPTLQSEPEE